MEGHLPGPKVKATPSIQLASSSTFSGCVRVFGRSDAGHGLSAHLHGAGAALGTRDAVEGMELPATDR